MAPAAVIETNRRVYLESLGRRIKAGRLAMGGMSQQRLADICGVRQATISKLERGTLEPSFKLLWTVAGALGKSMEELGAFPAVVPPFPVAEAVA